MQVRGFTANGILGDWHSAMIGLDKGLLDLRQILKSHGFPYSTTVLFLGYAPRSFRWRNHF